MHRIINSFLNRACKKYSHNEYLLIEKALFFAEKYHTGQKRRSGEPYIYHPVAVASILIDWNMSGLIIVAGLLHDIVEDCEITLNQIKSIFGREIFLYLFILTKDFSDFNNIDFIKKNIVFVKQSPEAMIIKLADRLHNMQTLDSMPYNKQQEKTKETLSVYIPIARILGYPSIADELKKNCSRYF